MKVLYAGDSPPGGAANYLLGILNYLKTDLLHFPPGVSLPQDVFKDFWDVIIFSDYKCDNVPYAVQKKIVQQVHAGTGFWMIGGWASFTGLNAGWKNSLIESILPVKCLAKDDRRNFFSGAVIQSKSKNTILKKLSFEISPVICGLNKVLVKKDSQLILSAQLIGKKGMLIDKEYPLLIINKNKQIKTMALTTDLAPHWCGGLVDWGNRRQSLSVNKDISVEVGNFYIRFVSSLLDWLSFNH